MAVVALASAKGSPGATLTAMALASVWPTPPVVADLDPAGGDLGWRLRAPNGDPLDQDRGLLSLGAAVRRGAAETTLGDHLQETRSGFDVLVGVASPAQLSGLGAAWAQLPQVFRSHPTDVIVDCGRVVPGSASLPVLLKADVVVLAVRPDVEGIAHLRERLRELRDPLGLGAPEGIPVGVAVVTAYRDTRSVGDLQQLMDSERLPVRVLGAIAHEPKVGPRYIGARGGRPRDLITRSAQSIAEQILGAVGGTRAVSLGKR